MDALLATVHHFLAFGLVAIIAIEATMLRSTLDRERLLRLAAIDRAYGMVAGALLLVGIARLGMGAKGWAFYSGNPAFWLKMVAFIAIGLLSIAPTVSLIRWTRPLKKDPSAPLPAPNELAATLRWVSWQLRVLPLVLIGAALMARGIGN